MGILEDLDIGDLITNTKEKIKKIYLQDEMPWIIGYSGGKDSTCTTQIVIDSILDLKKEGLPLKKNIYIISADTMVETPMIIDTIKFTMDSINTLAVKNGLPIKAVIVRPEYDRGFWANLIGRGYPCPNQTFRWCTDRMKIEPANRFTESILGEYGQAVMVLGVRDGESNSRDRVLASHTIEGKDLMRHTTQANSYVFAPIRPFTKDDVWNYLLTYESPWGGDNEALFKLYNDSLTGEECPLIMTEEDKKKTTCGNSRFGCWVCTVVNEDKSLTGFIKSGIKWLEPLLAYRNWLYSIRDNDEMRMKRRANGSIYFAKISSNNDVLTIASKGKRMKNTIKKIDNHWVDDNGFEWHVFDSEHSEEDAKKYIISNNIDLTSGDNPRIIIKKLDDEYYQLGLGPFTLDTRRDMLRRLLITQRDLKEKHELIKPEELVEIQKLWRRDGDIINSVEKLYSEVFGKSFNISEDDITVFSTEDLDVLENLCNIKNFSSKLFLDLVDIERKYSGYSNRADAQKDIKNKLSQEYLLLKDNGDVDEDKYY